MPIQFRCPHCRARLSITRRKAGMTTTCPRCRQEVRVPEIDRNPTTRLAEPPSPGTGSTGSIPLPEGRSEAALFPSPSPREAGEATSSGPFPLSSPPVPPPLPLLSSAPPLAVTPAPVPPPVPTVSPVPALPVPPPLPTQRVPRSVPNPPNDLRVVPPATRSAESATRSAENAPKSRPARSAAASHEPPLFERDIDALLESLQDTPASRKQRSQPTTGVDAAMILDNRGPPSEYAQRITSIVVIAFTLVVLAFLTGLFIAMR